MAIVLLLSIELVLLWILLLLVLWWLKRSLRLLRLVGGRLRVLLLSGVAVVVVVVVAAVVRGRSGRGRAAVGVPGESPAASITARVPRVCAGDDHGLMKRSFERGPGRSRGRRGRTIRGEHSRCGLTFPHFHGLDADVVDLFLGKGVVRVSLAVFILSSSLCLFIQKGFPHICQAGTWCCNEKAVFALDTRGTG